MYPDFTSLLGCLGLERHEVERELYPRGLITTVFGQSNLMQPSASWVAQETLELDEIFVFDKNCCKTSIIKVTQILAKFYTTEMRACHLLFGFLAVLIDYIITDFICTSGIS
jgi:hypothetical protein